MARYDKYDGMDGGFRALLAADWLTPLSTPIGVGLDTAGHVVAGAGNTGITGILILTQIKHAGDVVDVMTDGEIVEMATGVPAVVAGTVYYAAAADGTVTTTNTGTKLGHTVEADRLVLRMGRN